MFTTNGDYCMIRRPPKEAPTLYKAFFKERKKAFRYAFKLKRGREPAALTNEDYAPVTFFLKVWGEIAESSFVTGGYLERVDRELYFALLNYCRGTHNGRRGRENVTLRALP